MAKAETMRSLAKLTPVVAVGALSSPLEVGADRAPAAARDLAAALRRAGCRVVDLGSIGTPDAAVVAGRRCAAAGADAIALAPASWFEDYLVLDLLEEWRAPLLFWPLPGVETGALCGTQQLTCYLKQLGQAYAGVFGPADSPECLQEALVFLRAAALRARLRRARIGLAGQRIGGMTHTAPNEFQLKRVLGPRVVPLDLANLLAQAQAMPAAATRRLWQKVQRRAGRCDVDQRTGTESLALYGAVKGAVAMHGLQALTIGCYPHLMGKVCLPASLLADEGIPLACEGDVHGAVGMYLLQLLTGAPTHNTDWLDPMDETSVVFTHCGSGSFTLAEKPREIRLGSVRLMGQGVCALFTAKPGPVTLVSLLARGDGYQCAVLEGEAVPTRMVFPGNPLQVRFGVPVRDLIHWIFAEGIGHHWMIGYGHVAAELRAWAALCGPGLHLVPPPAPLT